MNESLVVRFESSERSLKVTGFRRDEGIVFDEHPDASPLNLALGLQPLFPRLLDPVRQRRDWRSGQFLLNARVESGALVFSGFLGDPQGLPVGPYDVTVEVEAFRFHDAGQRIIIRENAQTEMVLHEDPDPRRVQLRSSIDPLTLAVLENPKSVVDGEPLMTWLKSPIPRAARKACTLNVLAKMRVPVAPAMGFTDPLIGALNFLYFADVDRVYASAKPGLQPHIEKLVASELWVREGRPNAPIHERLLDSLTRLGISPNDARSFALTSYRQGGRNCLQIVVAAPPSSFPDPTLYLDIDIDLGNPLWDLEGLLVHAGELLDPGRTDHLALYKKLDRGETADFLYYDIVEAAGAAG